MSTALPTDGYAIVVRERDGTNSVVIVDGAGTEVNERVCGDVAEARIYASTVRQHLYWLSTERFREYYQLPEP